ncbi:MAG: ShlB/FhaC/HecB family hemolysin secretion/activation protein [Sulfuritalea sp.]|nr:ShlB/FhaC/HecB family hemolysin secretion/activation protein [Sulfuritalea sp.]
MLKTKPLIIASLLAFGASAFAQQPPNAGSQMQQIPPVPIPEKAIPNIEVAPPAAPTGSQSADVRIVVNKLSVTGAQVYAEAELLALTGFVPGSELTLTDLRGMAAKIANHYRRDGYLVAQAYLPAQDIKDGAVTIAVIEGHYGKVTLNNQTNLSNDLAMGLLDGINSGDIIEALPLESHLLLLSDVPGVKVRSNLVPGASVGTSDLIVDVTPGPRVSGEVDFDNAGNRYTGEYRLGATVNLNNLAGRGDVASLRGMTSGPGLNYLRGSYQMQFGKATAGVAYSVLEYKLGREFESLKAHGTAKIASIYGSYPLIRSRNNNLNAGLTYEDKTFQDKEDITPSVTDKKAHVLLGSLYGDHRDSLGGGGASGYSLTWSTGEIDIQTPGPRAIDALTAKTNGHYDKLGFTAMRLQRVTDRVSIYGGIAGQFASKNLDSSEKMELGGMYGVRAYPEGEAYADEGYVAHLEARYLLPKFSATLPGQMHLIGFVDTGSVKTHKNPWVAGPNSRTLSGIGIGLSWAEANNFLARAYYAVKLGNEKPTSAPDQSGRLWFQLVKYF